MTLRCFFPMLAALAIATGCQSHRAYQARTATQTSPAVAATTTQTTFSQKPASEQASPALQTTTADGTTVTTYPATATHPQIRVMSIPMQQLTPTSREGDASTKSNAIYSSNIIAVYIDRNASDSGTNPPDQDATPTQAPTK